MFTLLCKELTLTLNFKYLHFNPGMTNFIILTLEINAFFPISKTSTFKAPVQRERNLKFMMASEVDAQK
jgi:hypothetical protein